MSDSTRLEVHRILAIDRGKFNSVACTYDPATGEHAFTKIRTRPQVVHDLIVDRSPDRVVIEIGSQAGWVKDLCEALGVQVQVAKRREPFRYPRARGRQCADVPTHVGVNRLM